ncbi:MAG: glycosyltransferase family 2 protein [Treponema sp.]|nr:glycosyltransferase family 2 protein [Treponema sp.]
MKTITVLVPTYNEEKNIPLIYERLRKVFTESLGNYECRFLFVDNSSTDSSQELIRGLCRKDASVCAIFNVKNFGFARSQFNGLREAEGDAVVMVYADMQDPPEVIPRLVAEWEKGAKVVCGVKRKSRENPLMFLIRRAYYRLIKRITEVDHIDQFNGFGLYDRSFIEILRKLDDNLPYLRGIVAEFGADRKEVPYEQDIRRGGKSSFHFLSLYDFAMLGITSYSKVIMHLCTIIGAFASLASIIVSVWTLIVKLVRWETFAIGAAATQIGVFFLGSMQLFFIGFVGEYIANINIRTMRHPVVIEKERINFREKDR